MNKRPHIFTLFLGCCLAAGCGESSFESFQTEEEDAQSVNQRVCADQDQALEIVSRASWGARPPRSTRPSHVPNRITVHHTVQGNISGPAAVRAVQDAHMNGNGWSDIGYHFLVDRDGTIYEGNPQNLVGAHVASQNTGNLGIAMIGSFHVETLGTAQKRAVASLIRHLAQTYDIPVNRSRVKGHKERLATICPGNVDLNELVSLAASDASCMPSTPPAANTPAYDPVEVYWARLGDGSYKLHAIAGTRTVRVEYYVDGFKIGDSTRAQGANFPDTYTFSVNTPQRKFEVIGFDANDKLISRGIGLIDVTDEVAVYIRQMTKDVFEVGLERAPAGVAGLEVEVDGAFLLEDSLSGESRSTRGAVRHGFSQLGKRAFKLTTYNADGSVRGYLYREFDLLGGAEAKEEAPAPSPTPTTAKGYAASVLKAHEASRLTLWNQSFGRFDGADPLSNIQDAAAGRAAKTSCHGTAPCDEVTLKAPLLRAMHQLREVYDMSYFVTSISGASHSANSLHYDGRAVDIDEVNGVLIRGDSPQARALMEACRRTGAIEVFGPSNDPYGHADHVHCAW